MLFPIIHALRRAVRRGYWGKAGIFGSLKVNNFFFFVLLLIAGAVQSGLPPWSAYPFLAILGLLLLFPASSDPLEKIPRERLSLWPLGAGRMAALRLASLALSPVFWIVSLLILKTFRLTAALPFLALVVGVRVIARTPGLDRTLRVPMLPGALGGLISNNMRQMLTISDTWLAIFLGALGLAYRLPIWQRRYADPEALPIFGMLVALALSTWAQSLFGLDFESATTRYRLLPLPGWQILLAKDLAFLGILLVLTAPLSPAPAFTFGLISLAIGHHSSVTMRLPQRRWRFTSGRLLPVGALQFLMSIGFGFAELRSGPAVLAAALLLYGASLAIYSRRPPPLA